MHIIPMHTPLPTPSEIMDRHFIAPELKMTVLHSLLHCFDLAEILILHTYMFCCLHCRRLPGLIHNCTLMQRKTITFVLS
jgi:hypothetical protein